MSSAGLVIATLRPFPDEVVKALSTLGVVHSPPPGEVLEGQAALEHLRRADAAFVSPLDTISARMLEGAGRLRAISCAGAGLDRIDLDSCAAHGVRVVSAPDATSETTADLVFALLLASTRRLVEADRMVRSGRWAAGASPPWGFDAHHRTLGIVGFGRIGQAVARRAQGFSMRVIYSDRAPLPQVNATPAAAWRELPALLAEADFVVLQTPLTPATRNLVSRAELKLMKPTSFLINCGRGGVLDEVALAEALEAGGLAGAALDVYAREPDINPRLLACPNLTLTPHIGTATRAARRDMAFQAIAKLSQLLRQEDPPAHPGIHDPAEDA